MVSRKDTCMNNQEKKREEVTTAPQTESPEPNTVPIIIGAQATLLPTYDPCPKWLNHCGLPPTARIVYLAIYHRAISLSLNNHGQYSNDQGHIFVIYTNAALAKDCDLKLSALKSAKNILKEKGYITIEKIKRSKAVRIYPHFPADAKTYAHSKTTKKNIGNSNSSFSTDEFFDASLKKHLSPEAYEAYHNSQT